MNVDSNENSKTSKGYLFPVSILSLLFQIESMKLPAIVPIATVGSIGSEGMVSLEFVRR